VSVHPIARAVCIGLAKANASRVLVFHSNVQRFSEGPPPTIQVVFSRAEGENLKFGHATWTAQEIADFTEIVCDLCDDLARISHAVMNEEFRESLRRG
jgi:hypothetical protein